MNDLTTVVNIQEKVQIILRQTDLTEEQAYAKLAEHNDDHMKVIRQYLGIAEKKAPACVKSVNQEIYRQFREKLGGVSNEISK
jgi:hypothetical protein